MTFDTGFTKGVDTNEIRMMRLRGKDIPRVFSATDDLDNDNEDDDESRISSVTYHIERYTAGEQARQRQALGVLLGYERMAG